MRQTLRTLAAALLLYAAAPPTAATAQSPYCAGNRYSDTLMPDPDDGGATPIDDNDITIDSTLYVKLTDNRKDWMGNVVKLKYDIYTPPLDSPSQKRPFIMLVYGGGFTGGNRGQMRKYGLEFAKRGYVAFAIDYRLGKDTNASDGCTDINLPDSDIYSDEKAQYRAIQDADAALRHFIRTANQNGNPYHIDTAWAFVGGYSAGAGICNGLVYATQAEINAAYPTTPSYPTSIQSQLGNLKGSLYGGTDYRIKAVFNNWGAIPAAFYDSAEAVPMVAFHGAADSVVPYRLGIKYGKFVPDCGQNPLLMGSAGIADSLQAHGKCYDVTILKGRGHGVWDDSGVWPGGLQFRIGRAACFFKSLMCNTCSDYLNIVEKSKENNYGAPGGPQLADCHEPAQLEKVHVQPAPAAPGLYPNPATGAFYIAGNSATETLVELYDQTGRLVRRFEHIRPGVAMTVADLPSGLYFVQIKQEALPPAQPVKLVIAR